jgi:hypothetical protein
MVDMVSGWNPKRKAGTIVEIPTAITRLTAVVGVTIVSAMVNVVREELTSQQ